MMDGRRRDGSWPPGKTVRNAESDSPEPRRHSMQLLFTASDMTKHVKRCVLCCSLRI